MASVTTLPPPSTVMTAAASTPVVVVESDDGTRTMLSTVLSEAGFEVLPTADGLEALAAIKLMDGQPPGVIVLDASLPVMDAAAFLRAYRQLPGPHAPAIVLTDSGPEHLTDRTGPVAAVLSKPVAFDELLALVRRYAQPKTDTAESGSG